MKNLSLHTLFLALIVSTTGIQIVSATVPGSTHKPTTELMEQYKTCLNDVKVKEAALLTKQEEQKVLPNDATDDLKSAAATAVNDAKNRLATAKANVQTVKAELGTTGVVRFYVQNNPGKTIGITVLIVCGLGLTYAAYKYFFSEDTEVEEQIKSDAELAKKLQIQEDAAMARGLQAQADKESTRNASKVWNKVKHGRGRR